jgi:HSP20 family molecular chaperone IbpA
MSNSSSTELLRLHSRLNRLLREFTGMPFGLLGAAHETWSPAINAYWARDRIILCVDLAGVESSSIKLCVEPQCLVLRGRRELPEPKPGGRPVEQILAMEINHGAFSREIPLPEAVNPKRVTRSRRNGLLWITLPLAAGRRR